MGQRCGSNAYLPRQGTPSRPRSLRQFERRLHRVTRSSLRSGDGQHSKPVRIAHAQTRIARLETQDPHFVNGGTVGPEESNLKHAPCSATYCQFDGPKATRKFPTDCLTGVCKCDAHSIELAALVDSIVRGAKQPARTITSAQLQDLADESKTCFDGGNHIFWTNFAGAINNFFNKE